MTSRRHYVSTAQATTLSSAAASSGALTVASMPGTWPSAFPYRVLVDWGTSTMEACDVTAVSGTGPFTLTCNRGADGTTAQAHSSGAVVVHGFSAQDLGPSVSGGTVIPDYTVFLDGSTVICAKTADGSVAYSGTDIGAAIQAAVSALAGPGTVAVQAGTYALASTVLFPRSLSSWLKVIAEPGTTVTLSNTAKTLFSFGKVATGDVFQFIHVEGFTVDCGSLTQNTIQAALIGTWTTAGTVNGVSLDHITVRRNRVINGYAGATSSFTVGNLAVWLQANQDAAAGEALTVTNILVEELEVTGCQYAVAVGGQKIGAWTGNTTITGDNIRVREIRHDVGNDPPLAADTYAHVQVGSDLVAKTVWIERVWGRGSRDVGIEVDNVLDCRIRDCHFRNCHGFTILVTGFDPVPDVNNQVYSVEDCTLVRDAGSWDTNAASLLGIRAGTDHNGASVPVGKVTARRLKMYVSAASLNDIVTDGVSGDLVNCIASVTELDVQDASYYATGYQQTNTTTGSFPSVIYIAGTSGALTYSKVTLKDIDIFFNAVNGTGAAACQPDLIQLSGTLGFLLDNISVSMSVTNPTANAQTVLNLATASGTTTASGTIRRLKVVSQNDTSGTGVNIKASTNGLTIPNEILVTDCDFSGMSASLSAGRELQVADAVNAAKVRSRWNKWVTQPKASYTLTAPSSATATQFHEMWDSAVLFIGGTLTNLSVSKDGTNFFTIATAANANGILWRFTSGDYYKITYTAAPTIRVFPDN